ncbi:MAG: hypothetical protein AB1487_11215 [Thermodesulfobacteriota bacterium]
MDFYEVVKDMPQEIELVPIRKLPNPPTPLFAKGGKILKSPFGKGGYRGIFGWKRIK